MAIAIGALIQESNTFSPVATRYEDLDPVFGGEVIARHRGKLTEVGGFLDALGEDRQPVEPVGAAWAVTAGRVRRPDWARLTRLFLERLKTIRRPEALLLALHGAQTVEGIDDAEGWLLGRVRHVVGPDFPVVVTLDLHANVTRAMAEHASAIVGYHTYPHIDMYETGRKAAGLALRIVKGTIRPALALEKIPLIVPAENMQSAHGPFHRLVEAAARLERRRQAEAVSVFGVQPWLDIAEMGCSVTSVTNADPAKARRQAAGLAQAFWDSRRDFEVKLTPAREAIRLALKVEGGPVVLSESSDSTGSGSPGDSTGVLRPLLQAPLTGPAAIFVVDADVVARAVAAGVGNTLTARLGGKIDRINSKPVRVTGKVKLIFDGRWTAWGRGYNTGIETSMGRAVVLEVGKVLILVAERPAMTVDPSLYRSVGIEPQRLKIVVVKSPNGFRAEYAPIARKILLVDTPGISSANLRQLRYRRVPRPIWPLDRRMKYTAGPNQ